MVRTNPINILFCPRLALAADVRRLLGVALGCVLFCPLWVSLPLQAESGGYLERAEVQAWIKDTVKQTSLDRDWVNQQLSRATRQDSVLERISKPAEKTLNWGEYRNIFIKSKRINAGRKFLKQHESIFAQAEARFGVPASVVAAIIGVETFYGQYKGKDQALSALATLAFDYPRRAKFFSQELREFLLLAKEESFDPVEIRGSYAAAMGMPQFIASSYRNYAVDFDGDGRRDLWSSHADIIGSVANYLAVHGWIANDPVAEQVQAGKSDYAKFLKEGLKPQLKRRQLHSVGIRTQGYSEKEKSLMQLKADDGQQLWVGFHNFYVITRYNRSRLYAMAVHELSKALDENV